MPDLRHVVSVDCLLLLRLLMHPRVHLVLLGTSTCFERIMFAFKIYSRQYSQYSQYILNNQSVGTATCLKAMFVFVMIFSSISHLH